MSVCTLTCNNWGEYCFYASWFRCFIKKKSLQLEIFMMKSRCEILCVCKTTQWDVKLLTQAQTQCLDSQGHAFWKETLFVPCCDAVTICNTFTCESATKYARKKARVTSLFNMYDVMLTLRRTFKGAIFYSFFKSLFSSCVSWEQPCLSDYPNNSIEKISIENSICKNTWF